LTLDVIPEAVERAQTSLDDWRSPDFAPNLEKMQFPTVWNVVRYWRHCLETAGRKVLWPGGPAGKFPPGQRTVGEVRIPGRPAGDTVGDQPAGDQAFLHTMVAVERQYTK